nr:MAG TPA: vacuolar protein sorting-associated protein [Bacteriophage sp.]
MYLVSYYFKLFEAARLANLKRMAFLSGSWTTIFEAGL